MQLVLDRRFIFPSLCVKATAIAATIELRLLLGKYDWTGQKTVPPVLRLWIRVEPAAGFVMPYINTGLDLRPLRPERMWNSGAPVLRHRERGLLSKQQSGVTELGLLTLVCPSRQSYVNAFFGRIPFSSMEASPAFFCFSLFLRPDSNFRDEIIVK